MSKLVTKSDDVVTGEWEEIVRLFPGPYPDHPSKPMIRKFDYMNQYPKMCPFRETAVLIQNEGEV